MKSKRGSFLSKRLNTGQKCQGQHKHIFTKCSWSESTPTLKKKHKEQMRFWKPTEDLLTYVHCQANIFLNTEAPKWLMFPFLYRLWGTFLMAFHFL